MLEMSIEEKKEKTKKIKTTSEKDWQHGAVRGGGDGEIVENENKVLKRDSAEYESRSLTAKRNNL